MKKDISVSIAKANFYGVIIVLPLILILIILYIYIWKGRNFISELFTLEPNNFGLFMRSIFILIFSRQFIYGLSWQFFGKKQSNEIRYGINWKKMTPYTHCRVPIEVKSYKLGFAMPVTILGFYQQ